MTARSIRGLACAVAVLVPSVSTGPALADDDAAASLGDAFRDGKAGLDLRYRLERVDDDGVLEEGEASTLRTALSFRTQWWKDLQLFVEVEDVTDVGLDDDHNNLGDGSLANGETDKAVIADPDVTEIHQATLGWRISDDTTLTVGRQEVLLGNVRFVGNVGWRQNRQSFDAARVSTTAIRNTTLNYVYIENVNAITGADIDMSSHLIDAAIRVGDSGTVTAYGYLLDYDAALTLSRNTYGVRYAAGYPLRNERTLLVDLEAAEQRDAGDNPDAIDAGYWRAELGWASESLTVRAGLETLEGSAADGQFRTPLATLHKWNGWADKFGITPVDGLEDLYVSLGGTIGSVRLAGTWHDFSAESTGADHGTEIDLLASYTTSWKQTFAAKAALYDSDGFADDTTKIMLWTAWGF